jgi:hypothetical protein
LVDHLLKDATQVTGERRAGKTACVAYRHDFSGDTRYLIEILIDGVERCEKPKHGKAAHLPVLAGVAS